MFKKHENRGRRNSEQLRTTLPQLFVFVREYQSNLAIFTANPAHWKELFTF